jgi:hypothetical protein
MKEQLKEFAKDLGIGLVLFFGVLIGLAAFSYFTGFHEFINNISTFIGYGIAFFGTHALGKKVRAKFFKKD